MHEDDDTIKDLLYAIESGNITSRQALNYFSIKPSQIKNLSKEEQKKYFQQTSGLYEKMYNSSVKHVGPYHQNDQKRTPADPRKQLRDYAIHDEDFRHKAVQDVTSAMLKKIRQRKQEKKQLENT